MKIKKAKSTNSKISINLSDFILIFGTVLRKFFEELKNISNMN